MSSSFRPLGFVFKCSRRCRREKLKVSYFGGRNADSTPVLIGHRRRRCLKKSNAKGPYSTWDGASRGATSRCFAIFLGKSSSVERIRWQYLRRHDEMACELLSAEASRISCIPMVTSCLAGNHWMPHRTMSDCVVL